MSPATTFRALLAIVLSALVAASAVAEHKVFDTASETTHRRITWDDFTGCEHLHDHLPPRRRSVATPIDKNQYS